MKNQYALRVFHVEAQSSQRAHRDFKAKGFGAAARGPGRQAATLEARRAILSCRCRRKNGGKARLILDARESKLLVGFSRARNDRAGGKR